MNPFSPGAGTRPYELVGREQVLTSFDVAISRAGLRLHAQSKILYGLRGVGKTVLLREFVSVARRKHWIVIAVEAKPGESVLPALTRELFKEIRNAGRSWAGDSLTWVKRVFKSFSVRADPASGTYTFGVDLEPAHGYADSGVLDRDLQEMFVELAVLAGHHDVGVLVVIDELQEVERATLTALNATVHAMGQGSEPAPFLLAGAGLPSLRAILADATSYAERMYEFCLIDRLAEHDTSEALTAPMAAHGLSWDARALQRAVSFSGGYPYFVQMIGKHAWNIAALPIITETDVDAAIQDASFEIDTGLYASRWQRATPAEQQYMQAMADLRPDGAPVRVADLLAPLGKEKPGQLSPVRSNLISKGLVYVPDRGEVAFTVPGMAQYVARQVV